MIFSHWTFFVFFVCYFACHLAAPPKYRIYLIIIGSSIFYGWHRVEYALLPYLLTLMAWIGVHWMVATEDPKQRKYRMLWSLAGVFTPLLVVKYTYFLSVDALGYIVDLSTIISDPNSLKWALPLGISFITFTLVAYILDVYQGKYKPESSFTVLLAYLLFFPQLVAGPILRPHELVPQLKRYSRALDAKFFLGLCIFTLGLVKKVVFADQIGNWVDPIYAAGADPNGWHYLIGIYGFSLQIYCDFSGYTDMAIGIAYALRVRLPTNFLRPYCAASIIDFWRRWHITLSYWLRDYLYIFALGGNRKGQARTLANLMITMVLGGLWHGANWTFVVWGFIHGLALSIAHIVATPMKAAGIAIPKWLGILGTFHLVTAAWVYFRAPDIATAHKVLLGPFVADWPSAAAYFSINSFPVALIIIFLCTHYFDQHARIRLAVKRYNKAYVSIVIMFCWIIAITFSQGSSAKFIYFDF